MICDNIQAHITNALFNANYHVFTHYEIFRAATAISRPQRSAESTAAPTTQTTSGPSSYNGSPFLVLQQGKDGTNGRDGVNGRDGRDGLPGPVGPSGTKGEKGDPGIVAQGAAGPQGTYVYM